MNTTKRTYRKAVIGNFELMRNSRQSLMRNLRSAGLMFGSEELYNFRLVEDGVSVICRGAEERYTWEELYRRIELLSSPMAVKSKHSRLFHRIKGISKTGVSATYCGEAFEPDKSRISPVSEFGKEGRAECKNCVKKRTGVQL